jgi:HAD superfamily hydrolase (TIGR01549 family)
MLKLVVLDWDDCIVRGSSEAYYACYTAAIRENGGIGIDADTIKKQVRVLWGRPHQDVIASILGENNPCLAETVLSYEHLIFTDLFSKNLSLIPGSAEALASLKIQYELAIATGINATLLKEKLIPFFGMRDMFVRIISSSELPESSRGKPYPDMLIKLLEERKVSAKDAIMVGDAKGDVLMAQSAGVLPVVVLTGQLTHDEAVHLGVQHILSSVSALPALVHTL